MKKLYRVVYLGNAYTLLLHCFMYGCSVMLSHASRKKKKARFSLYVRLPREEAVQPNSMQKYSNIKWKEFLKRL